MSQLVAQLKASTALADGSSSTDPTGSTVPNPSLPLGALLIGRLALGRKPEDEVQGSHALFSANSTLQDWATQGTVVGSPINGNASAGAKLSESASAQTRLNQVFMVGRQDRYLSFTLSGIALDDAATGPDDALEVALLDANSGASLVGQTSDMGMTHTDALLNLQANGAELAASGVTHVTNQDGSLTYLVDLTGVAFAASGGTAVNLSFDLIGFGNTARNLGSHATVSQVRLLAQKPVPQTLDDSSTMAEDTA